MSIIKIQELPPSELSALKQKETMQVTGGTVQEMKMLLQAVTTTVVTVVDGVTDIITH